MKVIERKNEKHDAKKNVDGGIEFPCVNRSVMAVTGGLWSLIRRFGQSI